MEVVSLVAPPAFLGGVAHYTRISAWRFFFNIRREGVKRCLDEVWIGMTGGMDKHWGEKELPRVGHQLASCSLLIYYVVM